MKKLTLLSLLLALILGTASHSVAARPDKYPEITFDTLVHDFGTFSEDSCVVTCTFTFTNTGTAPLIIHQAIASCGCTVPTYTRTPVKPGEQGRLDITYNGTNRLPGKFKKSITVRSNARKPTTRLTIEGFMTESPNKAKK